MKDYFLHKAEDYMFKHKEHIEELRAEADRAFKPSNEDLDHPELWKPGSWKWYLEITPEELDFIDKKDIEGYHTYLGDDMDGKVVSLRKVVRYCIDNRKSNFVDKYLMTYIEESRDVVKALTRRE